MLLLGQRQQNLQRAAQLVKSGECLTDRFLYAKPGRTASPMTASAGRAANLSPYSDRHCSRTRVRNRVFPLWNANERILEPFLFDES